MSTLTHADLTAVMDALDGTANMYGPLRPDLRARVFAAVESPAAETWIDARSIIIYPPMRTLWQYVITVTGDRSAEAVPTASQILEALKLAAHDRATA